MILPVSRDDLEGQHIGVLTYDKVYRNLLTSSSKLAIFKIAFGDKFISEFDLYMPWDNWNIFCFTKFCFLRLFLKIPMYI